MDILPGELVTEIGKYLGASDVRRTVSILKENQLNDESVEWYQRHLEKKCIQRKGWIVKERLPEAVARSISYLDRNETFDKSSMGDYSKLLLAFPNNGDLENLPSVTHLAIYTNFWDSTIFWYNVAKIASSLEFLYISINSLTYPSIFAHIVPMNIFTKLKKLQIIVNGVCQKILNSYLFSVDPILAIPNLTHLRLATPSNMEWIGIGSLCAMPHIKCLSVGTQSLRSYVDYYSPSLETLILDIHTDHFKKYKHYKHLFPVYKIPENSTYLPSLRLLPSSLKLLVSFSLMTNINDMQNIAVDSKNLRILVDGNSLINDDGEMYEAYYLDENIKEKTVTGFKPDTEFYSCYFSYLHDDQFLSPLEKMFSYNTLKSCSIQKSIFRIVGEVLPVSTMYSCYCCDMCGSFCSHHLAACTDQIRKERTVVSYYTMSSKRLDIESGYYGIDLVKTKKC